MNDIIHCSLLVNGLQMRSSFEVLKTIEGKPYIHIGKDYDNKIIEYFLEDSQIRPDVLGRPGHLDYQKQIVVN